MTQARKNLIPIICLVLTSVILIGQVHAEASKLFVRNVEFNQKSLKVGEDVNIKLHVSNLSKNKTCCNITIFCGGKKLKQEEITIEGQSSTPVYHSFNTGGMAQGSYSVETMIENSDQQKMFDLGQLNLVDGSIISEPALNDSITVDSFSSLVALLLVPIGIISSIIIITQYRNKKSEAPEEELGIEEIPKLLGGIFSMQEQREKNEEIEEIQAKNGYIC